MPVGLPSRHELEVDPHPDCWCCLWCVDGPIAIIGGEQGLCSCWCCSRTDLSSWACSLWDKVLLRLPLLEVWARNWFPSLDSICHCGQGGRWSSMGEVLAYMVTLPRDQCEQIICYCWRACQGQWVVFTNTNTSNYATRQTYKCVYCYFALLGFPLHFLHVTLPDSF